MRSFALARTYGFPFSVLLAAAGAPRSAPASANQGLAQYPVTSVAQDRSGFLWVGTEGGLQRFDGHGFVRYVAFDSLAPAELAGPIGGVLVDREGRLWVATQKAVFRLEPARRSVVRIPLQSGFEAWASDSTGRLWLVDGGTLTWIGIGEARPVEQTVGTPGAFQGCYAMATGPTGTLWVARVSKDGESEVLRVDPLTANAVPFPTTAGGPPGDIVQDFAGRVWVSGSNGLNLLSPGTDRFRPAEQAPRAAGTGFVATPRREILAATDSGLVVLDSLPVLRRRWSPGERAAPGPLPRLLALDREGGMWLSTSGGLSRVALEQPGFERRLTAHDYVTAVLERGDGTLWVGTLHGGVYRISPDGQRTDTMRYRAGDPATLPSDEIWDITEDDQGNVWVAATGGLCRSLPTGFRCYPVHGPPRPALLDIEPGTTGRLWAAHRRLGAIGFNTVTGEFGPIVSAPEFLGSTDAVGTLHFERGQSELWFGNNLLFRTPINDSGATLPARRVHRGGPIYQLYRDRQGALWMGAERGLFRWNEGSTSFTPVTVPELQNAAVFWIVEDAKGELWLGTSQGLLRYSPAQSSARRYLSSEDYPAAELNRRAAVLRRDGSIVFGGSQGLTQFDPSRVGRGRDSVPVVFTKWRRLTTEGPIDQFLDGVQTLRLGSGDRAFSLEFTPLSFAPDPSRRFRYRLAELGSNWIETTDGVATLGGLRPGHYTFQVQTTSGPEGQWTSAAAMPIEVPLRFWTTSWFRVAVVLLLVALAWAAHRWQLNRVLTRDRLSLARSPTAVAVPGGEEVRLLGPAVESRGNGSGNESADVQPADLPARVQAVATTALPGVRVSFEGPPEDAAAGLVGSEYDELVALYREVLENVAWYAQASKVRVSLQLPPDGFELSVTDNGSGFSPLGTYPGTGLKSLREHADRLGGRIDFQIEPGQGTTARVVIPRPLPGPPS